LGLFLHEPPEDTLLLSRVCDLVPNHIEDGNQASKTWKPLAAFRPHSFSDGDLKETRQDTFLS
jgi:hypothetical protein